jgi:general nucleoside transport system permease protein
MDFLDMFLNIGFWAATVRMATPLIFGTLGELICERAGVLNLGIEGIMTTGAMVAWMWVYQGGDLWTAVAVAAVFGMMFGLLHSWFSVYMGLSQHVTGIGITLLATSLSYYSFRMLLPGVTTPPKIVPFSEVSVPVLSDIPIFGEALFNQSPLTYMAFISVGVVAYILYKTPAGLAVRMVGENPMAVEVQGIDVYRVRTAAVMVGSGFMAIGGAFLTISVFDAFYFDMVNGRGWICVALVIFASWRPGKALLGAMLFAAFDAIQIRVQQSSISFIPYQFFLMMPYIFSILALVIMSRKAAYPKALLVPFRRGQR